MSLCPRCGFRGQSVGYFSRGTHVAALVALAVLTAGLMGAAGIGYWLLRREHRICPRCGDSWGRHGTRAISLATGQPHAESQEVALSDGSASSAFGWVLYVFAAILVAVGIAETAIPAILIGGGLAAGGFLLQRGARAKREARREAMIQGLQLPVLQLARARGGRLTVTETAAALGWTLPRAEKVLASLEDGLRISSDVTDEGVIVYEFRELMHGSASAFPEWPTQPLLPPDEPGPGAEARA